MNLASNLRILRKIKGKTISDVAEDFNLGASAISAYELGKAEPRLITLEKLATYYGVKLEELLYSDLENHHNNIEKGITNTIKVDFNENNESDLVSELKKRIEDKEEMIQLLKEQLDFYKNNSK